MEITEYTPISEGMEIDLSATHKRIVNGKEVEFIIYTKEYLSVWQKIKVTLRSVERLEYPKESLLWEYLLKI